MQPLADRVKWHLLHGHSLYADQTPVAQLDLGRGITRGAYLWVYHSNDLASTPSIVVFDYQGSRNGAHARQFLAAWQRHTASGWLSGLQGLIFNAKDPDTVY